MVVEVVVVTSPDGDDRCGGGSKLLNCVNSVSKNAHKTTFINTTWPHHHIYHHHVPPHSPSPPGVVSPGSDGACGLIAVFGNTVNVFQEFGPTTSSTITTWTHHHIYHRHLPPHLPSPPGHYGTGIFFLQIRQSY